MAIVWIGMIGSGCSEAVLEFDKLFGPPRDPPPLEASDLLAEAISSTAINLSWTSSGTEEVLFRLRYLEGTSPPADCTVGLAASALDLSAVSTVVSGLRPATVYSFRLCTVNRNQPPDVSDGITASALTPNATDPPPNPLLIIATAISPSEIHLSWSSGGGSTTSYRISYQVGNMPPVDCASGTTIPENLISDTFHNLTGLSLGTPYSIRICATNSGAVSTGLTTTAMTTTPLLSSIKKLAKGYHYSCAIRSDDTLWCWGSNPDVIGPPSGRATPMPIAAGTTWKAISAGTAHACGIDSSDSVQCWGHNSNGQLGDGTTTSRSTPVPIFSGATWLAVSAGEYHTCGIKTDGSLWCWGNGAYGQRGDDSVTQIKTTPTAVSDTGPWKLVSAGNSYTCAIKSDDTLWCWGFGGEGQRGDGSATTDRLTPVQVSGGGLWRQVAAGNSHTCGIKTEGSAHCWGRGFAGQTGSGTSDDRLVPTPVSGSALWQVIARLAPRPVGFR